MPIKVLASEVVSKIAAGEVIERPASVVKELIENSLDAEAKIISIETRGGGVSLIKVMDNGTGIPSEEVETAFLRHATSKIDKLDDLKSLSTLGFRGEALPSIAAVSDVEILTRTDNEAFATYLKLVNGKVTLKEKRNRNRGTTITVHYLFRHFPARLKFLKSQTTENSHIANLITRYVLAFPEVKFIHHSEGRENLVSPGNASLKDAVLSVYGAEVAEQMLDFSYSFERCSVSGMASPPKLARTNRNYLSFFINRRFVHSTMLSHAVEEAYSDSLMTGKHPIVIINLQLPQEDIDVNVHPSKIEVKFRNSQHIYNCVYKAIRQTLQTAPATATKELKLIISPTPINLFQIESQSSDIETGILKSEVSENSVNPNIFKIPILRVLGQMAASYILAEGQDGLYLIDQHAAHERIQFEKILKQRIENRMELQGLLDPLQIELTPAQVTFMNSSPELLENYGIKLEHFGGQTYLVRNIPSALVKEDLATSIKEIVDTLIEEKDPQKREHRLIQSLACHCAIKAGQTLSIDEMRELLRLLEQCENPHTCPHGRPTMIHLSARQLEKEFGRVR